MVQRLAVKGFLDYVPYKGSSLTPKGLKHGKMMKRRHRLAEVLLEHLPFEGNHHETACRLEHAIDDDLDVALSIYLGNPILDPSGRDIPDIKPELKERLSLESEKLYQLSDLKIKSKGIISMIIASDYDLKLLRSIGVEIGVEVINDGQLKLSDSKQILEVSDSLASKIILDLI